MNPHDICGCGNQCTECDDCAHVSGAIVSRYCGATRCLAEDHGGRPDEDDAVPTGQSLWRHPQGLVTFRW